MPRTYNGNNYPEINFNVVRDVQVLNGKKYTKLVKPIRLHINLLSTLCAINIVICNLFTLTLVEKRIYLIKKHI